MPHPDPLPQSNEVDSRTLSRLFDDTTNSYKYLFFLALLAKLEQQFFSSDKPIALSDLVVEMLVTAWYPHVYFRLSFGALDRIAQELDKVASRNVIAETHINPWDREAIHAHIAPRVQDSQLDRYVPYRLLVPFFPKEPDEVITNVERRVAEKSEQYFTSLKPLYKFDSKRKSLILHSDWCQYLYKNLPIVRDWIWWNFLQYMQRKNPSVPGISLKLRPEPERMSLSAQTKFWADILQTQPFYCIYSGDEISSQGFVLDHFVPWSFVVHNQLWNLVPTSVSTNSKKSDSLPHTRYFDQFVSAHHMALIAARTILPAGAWKKIIEPYVSDLSMTEESLIDKQQLHDAMRKTVGPLILLAEANGFEPNWTLHS